MFPGDNLPGQGRVDIINVEVVIGSWEYLCITFVSGDKLSSDDPEILVRCIPRVWTGVSPTKVTKHD